MMIAHHDGPGKVASCASIRLNVARYAITHATRAIRAAPLTMGRHAKAPRGTIGLDMLSLCASDLTNG
jgi:hypothetical protein